MLKVDFSDHGCFEIRAEAAVLIWGIFLQIVVPLQAYFADTEKSELPLCSLKPALLIFLKAQEGLFL